MSNPNWFHPQIFNQFAEVTAVHSLRNPNQPADFSIVRGGSEKELVSNRKALAEAAGFSPERVAVPRQVHGHTVLQLSDAYDFASRPRADAFITDEPGWLIGVAVADCVAVLLYDPTHHAIAAVHSGWRGSAQNIVGAAVQALHQHYHTEASSLYAFVSPAPAREEYEVERAVVSDQFDPKYSTPSANGKAWFDNKQVVGDQLTAAGIPSDRIEIDPRSNLSDSQFHSYRRDGEKSGRMIVAIGLHEAVT